MGWFFEPQLDWLWSISDNIWLLHGYVPTRAQTKSFIAHGVWLLAPPLELYKATVVQVGDKVKLTGYGPIK